MSPEDEMKTFSLPPGYRVELVASEPMIESPILMDFDADGRLWVLEMLSFLPDTSGRDSREPINRVSVLEDTNGDGRMDKKTVFADKLLMPRALKVLDHGVLIGEPPNLWLMKDTERRPQGRHQGLVVNTYGNANGGIEHNANSLFWAMDNIMYSSEHTWDLRWKNGKFEPLPALSRGQWQISQDDAGRIYPERERLAAVRGLHAVALLPAQSATASGRAGLYELLIEQMDATVYPVRNTRGVNRGYRDPFFRPRRVVDRDSGRGHADDLPRRRLSEGTAGQRVHHRFADESRARDDARRTSTAGCRRRTPSRRASSSRRRTSASGRWRSSTAPTAYMYIVDMYRGVVQAGGLWSAYLTDYIKSHEMELPVGRGRIWRVVYGPAPTRRARPRRRCRRPRRRNWCRRCRIRRAGGATRRSGCSSNAATSPWCRR